MERLPKTSALSGSSGSWPSQKSGSWSGSAGKQVSGPSVSAATASHTRLRRPAPHPGRACAGGPSCSGGPS
eukprot:11101626-Alexandrium_andersonii.AAC.1